MPSSEFWVLFTLAASAGQTLRNAMQRDLIGALGALGAAQVRFLFGLPFAILFLVVVFAGEGDPFPRLTATNLAWTSFGALAQVIGTTLMLAAMQARSFAVVIAYTKTEAAQVAVFALVFLNERPTVGLIVAIALAMIGVAAMSWRRGMDLEGSWGAAGLGILSASFFGLATVGFRAAVIGVATPSRALAASLTLVVGLAIQAALLAAYLAVFDRPGAMKILGVWRSSLFAGFMGAFASQLWFIAFALTDAARVRTLALVEVLFAQIVSLRMFREPPSLREILGMILIVVAAIILIASSA
jgi:drug/metabolite transporter (DMT)-like permease